MFLLLLTQWSDQVFSSDQMPQRSWVFLQVCKDSLLVVAKGSMYTGKNEPGNKEAARARSQCP